LATAAGPARCSRTWSDAEKTEQQSTGSDRCTWGGRTGTGDRPDVDLTFAETGTGAPDPADAIGELDRMIETPR